MQPTTHGVTPATLFWGKYDEKTSQRLPLAAHCLDVAMVFRSLCELNRMRTALELSGDRKLTLGDLDRLAVLAMLHDFGKANHGFQNKIVPQKRPTAGHTKEVGALLNDAALCAQLAGILSLDFAGWFDSPTCPEEYFTTTVSHHGSNVNLSAGDHAMYTQANLWRPQQGRDPMQGISGIVQWSRLAFPGAWKPGQGLLPKSSDFKSRFCGLVMLADWLGSHTRWFPIEDTDLWQRQCANRQRIPNLLRAVGLDIEGARSSVKVSASSFEERFGFQPHPLQACVDRLDPKDDTLNLIVVESETGSGKTEAALQWFYKLLVAKQVDGLYFALPTRVAARELYTRVAANVRKVFPDPMVRPMCLLAVPGYAQVDEVDQSSLLPSDDCGKRWADDDKQAHVDRCWAAERPKRYLAASIAVGTIDQALLSVLRTSHSQLRSVCLDRSLLVVDEVHASDEYMSFVLAHLIEGHLARGGCAMLLSATLGIAAKARYLEAASQAVIPKDFSAATAQAYPAITGASGTIFPTAGSGRRKTIKIEVQPTSQELTACTGLLAKFLNNGARVLVVLNTVRRAIELLRLVEDTSDTPKDSLFRVAGVSCPHHGRFAPSDRTLLDKEVSEQFGRQGARRPLLLIGTQTLEQSLDIDADIMITDLAPVDVLLQRLGRLHRHDRERPHDFMQPRCIVLTPSVSTLSDVIDGQGRPLPVYRRLGIGSVYRNVGALELTRRALVAKHTIEIPRDNRKLVEEVTNPECLRALRDESLKWERHMSEVEGEWTAQRVLAHYATSEEGGIGDRDAKTRLQADGWQVRLNRPVDGPFGLPVSELVIPGHLAPATRAETMAVISCNDGISVLTASGKFYRYSRFGVEEVTHEFTDT